MSWPFSSEPEPPPSRSWLSDWLDTLGSSVSGAFARFSRSKDDSAKSSKAAKASPSVETGPSAAELREVVAGKAKAWALDSLGTLPPRSERPARPTRAARLRARVLLSGLFIGYGGLAYRLHHVQIDEHELWSQRARAQQMRVREIQPERGRILAREGDRAVPVAVSIHRGSLMVEGREGRDVEAFMASLKKAVPDLSEEEARDVEARLQAGRAFYFRRRKLTPDDMARIRALPRQERLKRCSLEEEPIRAYPYGPLASQVLGIMGPVDVDGDGKLDDVRRGTTGLERKCESWLRGTPGKREVQLDGGRRRELVQLGHKLEPAIPGADVMLSIDRTIQRIADEELARTAKEHEPEGAAIVVVDPATGDVLAMASWPTFDPRDPGPGYAAGQHNRAIQHTYEPGSTIKPLLIATAWQLGKGGPERMINCPRRFKVPGRRKPVVDSHTVGNVPERQVVVQSSNSGAVQITLRLSHDQIRQTLADFGLGRRTGIPLPAEARGDTRSLRKMNSAHVAAVAQGYAVMVTPLQMALAYGALANGGTLLRPRLVRAVREREGRVIESTARRSAARPLGSEVTGGPLRSALAEVVNGKRGTARRAKSKRYMVAGKTGTTKKIVNGKYHEREVVASFSGFAPAEAPRLAFTVVVWGPSTKKKRAWGGTVAAPCAGRVADRALRLMRVPASPGTPEFEAEAKKAAAEAEATRTK